MSGILLHDRPRVVYACFEGSFNLVWAAEQRVERKIALRTEIYESARPSESIGASIWEVPPGEAAYPYHFHLADEELVIVLSGRPSLRTPDGIRDLEEGDAVRFPLGEEGAHQLLNRTQEVVRFLAVSNSGRPDIVVYPDSDKIRAAERLPAGDGFSASFHRGDAVDYWDGEAHS